jgi:hypothetical protein
MDITGIKVVTTEAFTANIPTKITATTIAIMARTIATIIITAITIITGKPSTEPGLSQDPFSISY